MTTEFHARPYGRFIKINSNLRRKKLQRTKQASTFLGVSFSKRGNVRAPVQFRREGQPQNLKRWFFLKNIPIHCHIITTWVIRPPNKRSSLFTLRVQSSIISIDINITHNITRKVINVTKIVAPEMEPWLGIPGKTSYTEPRKAIYYWGKMKYSQIPHLKVQKTWVCEDDQHAKTCQKSWMSKVLDIWSATAGVAPEVLKTLAVLSNTVVTRSAFD